MADKPQGFAAFKKLLKRVVAVPKEKVDARIEQARREHPRSTENTQKK